jgi:nucleotide-binding universal stress UspA family protein
MMFHKILIATDFTAASEPAVAKGLALAKETGSELMVAHACARPNTAQADFVAPGIYDEWEENLRESVGEKLEPILESARKFGIKARPLILTGNPEDAIPEAAQSNEADLVVMGTHGRTGVPRMFLGSVASRVIATAPCPVLTVH